MRRALAVLLALAAYAPPALAQPPHKLLVIGDSLAVDNSEFLHERLPNWKIENNFSFARSAPETARDLRIRARQGKLPSVIHVSSGTGDDPSRPDVFRRAVRRVMSVAGPRRCVVWAKVWRYHPALPTFQSFNFELDAEARKRRNLRLVDWYAMVEARRDWLVDIIHVNEEGNAARADAVAREVRHCYSRISSATGRAASSP